MTEVAKVSIGIEGDTSKLKADVAKATNEVNAAGAASADKATDATNKQSAATSALGDRLRSVKKTYGEQIEVVQGLIGKIAAIGGIATIFYKIGESISLYVIERLKTATENVNTFRESLDRMDSRAKQVQIGNKFDELNAKLATVESQFRPVTNLMLKIMPQVGGIIADDADKIRAEIKGLSDFAQGVSNNIERIRENAKQLTTTQDQEKAVRDFSALREQARRDSMTEEERIVADGEAKIFQVMAAWNLMSAQDRISTANATEDLIAQIRRKAAADAAKVIADAAEEARKKAEDERRKEEEWWDKLRKHQEEQDQRAKQTRESWSNAYRAIREESNRAFATDQAASMVQLAGQLRIEGMTAAANMNQIIVQGVG